MLPESDSKTLAHFGGLGVQINMSAPEVFDSGDFHVIFVGCRPVLVSFSVKIHQFNDLRDFAVITSFDSTESDFSQSR